MGRRLNKGSIKPNNRKSDGLRLAGSRPGNQGAPLGGIQCGSNRWRTTAWHATVARDLAVAAGAGAARRKLRRLHTHESGAKNGEKQPRNAFHRKGDRYALDAIGQTLFQRGTKRAFCRSSACRPFRRPIIRIADCILAQVPGGIRRCSSARPAVYSNVARNRIRVDI